jgi:hypothetical protein
MSWEPHARTIPGQRPISDHPINAGGWGAPRGSSRRRVAAARRGGDTFAPWGSFEVVRFLSQSRRGHGKSSVSRRETETPGNPCAFCSFAGSSATSNCVSNGFRSPRTSRLPGDSGRSFELFRLEKPWALWRGRTAECKPPYRDDLPFVGFQSSAANHVDSNSDGPGGWAKHHSESLWFALRSHWPRKDGPSSRQLGRSCFRGTQFPRRFNPAQFCLVNSGLSHAQ